MWMRVWITAAIFLFAAGVAGLTLSDSPEEVRYEPLRVKTTSFPTPASIVPTLDDDTERLKTRTGEFSRIAQEQADARAAAEEAARIAAEEAHQREHERQAAQAAAVPSGSVWDRLAECESHGQWNYGPHSGWGSGIYHGGLQFHPNTWNAYGGQQYAPYAYQATREQQIAVAERVLAAQGWGAWPACSRKLGLR